MDPRSPRLRYRRLTAADRTIFHRLCLDPHVRRYLLDGQIVPPTWAAAETARSARSFAELGVGLWLVEREGAPIGFCGFRRFDELGPEPQLLFALTAPHAGFGLATEMAEALVAVSRALRIPRVTAAVDAPNQASIRVLEKTGFRRSGCVPGRFGDTFLFERFDGAAPTRLPHDVARRFELTVGSTWDGRACDAGEAVTIDLALAPDEIVVTVDAPFFDDPPPQGPPGSTAALWEHEVVELMLLGADSHYLEVELSPHGHYLALLLRGARQVVHRGMVMHHHATITKERWRGQARIPMAWLPLGCDRLNAYAIHGPASAKRHLACRPPGGERPDFHRLDCFAPLPRI